METPAVYAVDTPKNVGRVVLMQCPLAGFLYYAGEKCWRQLRAGDSLSLIREPGNHNDPRAVRVEWNEWVLGYLPRDANYTICQMLDRGQRLEGRIARLEESHDPWKRVMLEIEWQPADNRTDAAGSDKPPGISYVNLGSFVAGGPPSKVELVATGADVTERVKRCATLILARCSADITARLAMPVTGAVTPAGRTVQLWGLLEIFISTDGRSLEMRSTHPAAKDLPELDANLDNPVGSGRWAPVFTGLLEEEMHRQNLHTLALAKPWMRWLRRSLDRTFRGFVDFKATRRAIHEFLAPDPLTQSLANRIFGNRPTATQFNWCGRHRVGLALAGVEHPRLLPFLREVERDPKARDADPAPLLPSMLERCGMQSAAFKRLERWGWEPFETFGSGMGLFDGPASEVLAGFANLLWRLGLTDPPPAFFCFLAGSVANVFYAGREASVLGTHVPDWFTRAMLREIQAFEGDEDEIPFGEQAERATAWLAAASPAPDSNQQKAGWSWIMERVAEFEATTTRNEWPVPMEECEIDGYRVIPIRTLAQLQAEALAMKNCLANYGLHCFTGTWAVFSIRGANGKRIASMAAVKSRDMQGSYWRLQQVVGKANTTVSPEVEFIAGLVVQALNAPPLE